MAFGHLALAAAAISARATPKDRIPVIFLVPNLILGLQQSPHLRGGVRFRTLFFSSELCFSVQNFIFYYTGVDRELSCELEPTEVIDVKYHSFESRKITCELIV